MNIPADYSSSALKHHVHLELTETSSTSPLPIAGHNYKILGRDEEVSAFRSHINNMETVDVDNFGLLSSSKKLNKTLDIKPSQEKTMQVFQERVKISSNENSSTSKETQKIVSDIKQSDGSRQEIKKILSTLPLEISHIPQLMDIACSLALDGSPLKASHVFSFIQEMERPFEEKIVDFVNLGKAFLSYGLQHGDVMALDCAEFHLAFAEDSQNESLRQEGKACVEQIIIQLKRICNVANEKTQAYNLMDRIEINQLLGANIRLPVKNRMELELLKKENPEVKKAFIIAQELQLRVDAAEDSDLQFPGQMIQIGEGKEAISIYVNITGQRQRPEDPIIVLEPGMGCFSSDWDTLQKSLTSSKKFQVMSYDPAGMGKSPKMSVHSPESSRLQLEQILQKTGLKPPYIFVGHSYGGVLSQLYALKHPQDIHGLILVDCAIETLLPPKRPPPSTVFEYLPPAAQLRMVQNDHCYFLEEKTAILVQRLSEKSRQLDTFLEQEKGLEVAAKELQEQKKTPILDCLLTVIGRGLADGADNWEQWKIEQFNLATRSSKGKYLTAEKSDHFIMYHEPHVIEKQIVEMAKESSNT